MQQNYTPVGQQVSPAIGDIRLEKLPNSPYYEVLIYYTDGVNPPDWGGICADITQSTVNVLCRQLGFLASGSPLPGYSYIIISDFSTALVMIMIIFMQTHRSPSMAKEFYVHW